MIQTIADALSERGYDTLTDVQQAVTDPELAESDLLVSAQTGSGKTVGFGLAIAPTLLPDDGILTHAGAPIALIIAPTRELAMQVTRELQWLYANARARVVSCVGGMDARSERRALERGAHIVVGTPGRLCDHINRGALDMSALRAVVLDEADEMLDMGFREDLEFMLGEAPDERRTLLFSATVPPMIATLAKQYQRDAVRISTLSKGEQHTDISYQVLRVAPKDTENAIFNLLRYHDADNAIVFANTRAMVARLTARFSNRGLAAVSLSGELSQNERTHALQAMRDGRARVCVATDVAARGIDLPKLDLVIHAELPTNTEALLHRSGRTGRAGRKGVSALIVSDKAAKKAQRLLRWAKIEAEWTQPPTAEMIVERDHERLLADPLWTDPLRDDEAGFVARLLETHTPEAIAAACLRLHQSRTAAPEELSPPDAPREKKERAPFGPSVWFSLSVGRAERAEPRWLLPMLCRVGNLTKEAIGAIRIQDQETFVELAEAHVDSFQASLGDGNTLEDGIKARRLDGVPSFAPRPRREAPPERSAWAMDRPEGKRDDKRGPKPAGKRPYTKPERKPTPMEEGAVKPLGNSRPDAGKKPQRGKPEGGKVKGQGKGKPPAKPHGAGAPKGGSKRAADPSKRFTPPKGGKPGAKPEGKPRGPKPAGGFKTKASKGGDARPRKARK